MVPASVAAHSLRLFFVIAAMGLSANGITTMAKVSAERNHVGAFHSSACIGNHACAHPPMTKLGTGVGGVWAICDDRARPLPIQSHTVGRRRTSQAEAKGKWVAACGRGGAA
jgi:hypothetical protein